MERAPQVSMTPSLEILSSVTSLVTYCKGKEWAGYDPYDALNSRLYSESPLYRSRLCNIAFTQIMKRLPVNLRPLLQIPPEQNAKGIALSLSALLKLTKLKLASAEDCHFLAERLVALRSPEKGYWCWGYSFPWQTRKLLVPKGAPNLVCTSFVANALLDAYQELGEARYLTMAVSAADYIRERLYWSEGESVVGFSYPLPGVRVQVHNANFLAAALLCRVYHHTNDRRYLDPALRAARYSAGKQSGDGSWVYGELSSQRWVDNFHTGFNLCALRTIGRHANTSEFEPTLRRGFRFYVEHFFRQDGAPKYYHNRTYPIDVHSFAQSLITLVTLEDLHADGGRLSREVCRWGMNHLWDRRGYFHYRVGRLLTNRISYMRWSQAWMLLALSVFLEYTVAQGDECCDLGSSASVEVAI